MKPVLMRVVSQCGHQKPCAAPPEAEPETRWRATQTIEVIPPAKWTRQLLERFIGDLAASANISDVTLVEFRGGPEPGIVTVNGNGHSLSMALPFVPDQVLGPWLLSKRQLGDIWSAVHRPQPRDASGQVRQPEGGA